MGGVHRERARSDQSRVERGHQFETVGSGGVDYNNTVAVSETFVWVAVPDDGKVLAFDPASGDQVADVDVGGPGLIAAGPAGVWVGLENGTLLQVDERTLAITTSIKTGSEGYNLVEVGRTPSGSRALTRSSEPTMQMAPSSDKPTFRGRRKAC